MGLISTKDGTGLFYKDWGEGPVAIFSHGRRLDADTWEDQLFTIASAGYRVVAHDRRGYGRAAARLIPNARLKITPAPRTAFRSPVGSSSMPTCRHS